MDAAKHAGMPWLGSAVDARPSGTGGAFKVR